MKNTTSTAREITVSFFADRSDVEQVITLTVPAGVPVLNEMDYAKIMIRRQYPEAHSYTKVMTDSTVYVAVECGMVEGYATAAAGY